jgi:NAD(P)-dependent dehydrogenase (short-subunit alcohol dehydrogenase family)
MNYQLQGKQALVTGSTAGIGFAIARLLAQEGATVIINGRSAERVSQACQRIAADIPGAQLQEAVADLADAAETQQLIANYPEVDILVNNLGIFEPKPFEEISDDDWFGFFAVNVMSGVRLSRHYLGQMKARNWGRIVFISSESGVHIPAEMIHYGLTKAAQIAIARGLAETTVGTGVTVNSVLPGPTRSEGVVTFVNQLAQEQGITFAEMEQRFFREFRPSSLLKRFITPEEVANMVVYVCSPLSSATNGAALRVEGGVVTAML